MSTRIFFVVLFPLRVAPCNILSSGHTIDGELLRRHRLRMHVPLTNMPQSESKSYQRQQTPHLTLAPGLVRANPSCGPHCPTCGFTHNIGTVSRSENKHTSHYSLASRFSASPRPLSFPALQNQHMHSKNLQTDDKIQTVRFSLRSCLVLRLPS